MKRFLLCLAGAGLWSISMGCGASDSASSEMGSAAPPGGAQAAPAAPVEIEESDLYRLDESLLYVQNPTSGLNVIDMVAPATPRLLGTANVTGRAGELYLRQPYAIVLLKSASPGCRTLDPTPPPGWALLSEIAVVDVGKPAAPHVVDRWCLPGAIVNSRLVGPYLLVVSNREESAGLFPTAPVAGGAQALSVDMADPASPKVVSSAFVQSGSREIHVTQEALWVAGWRPIGSSFDTELTYVGISAADGKLARRGSIVLPGQPQGRFHMDAWGALLRIATFERGPLTSRLSVVDASDPDALKVVGTLSGLAPGERLFASRFVGPRGYLVTYGPVGPDGSPPTPPPSEPPPSVSNASDPLWVIDLQDPTKPRILGELIVPGWSDFIYPRGDRLFCVGRGNQGFGVQASWFDIATPSAPRTIGQATFGARDARSEAENDHRGVTVTDAFGEPLAVVPYSTRTFDSNGCHATNALALIDLEDQALRPRGVGAQAAPVRRSVFVGDRLVGISGADVVSFHLANRDQPQRTGAVTVAAAAADPECVSWRTYQRGGCSVPAGSRVESRWTFAALAAWGTAARRRRRRGASR